MTPEASTQDPWSQQHYGGSNLQQDWRQPTDLMPPQPTSSPQLYTPNVMTGHGPDGESFQAEALVFSGMYQD